MKVKMGTGMRKLKQTALLLVLAAAASGCGREAEGTEPASGDEYPREAVEMIAPAGRGGGYDLTMRTVAQCLTSSGQVPVPLPVTNKPGDGGSVALEYLAENKGSDTVLSVFSPPICLINLNGTTSYSYKENTTPVAKLLVDYGCFAVRSDSPYEDLGEVMEALKEDPSSLTIGGTSSIWSMDHLQFLVMARAAGVEGLDQIPYSGFENGGAVSQLMGGRIDVLSAGISDVVGLMESGDLRVLAVTSGERLDNETMRSVPTCMESGIDEVFFNWRGIFGPEDMPDYALNYWEETLENMARTECWEEYCSQYGWTMDYMGHEEFEQFLDETNEEYRLLLEEVMGGEDSQGE